MASALRSIWAWLLIAVIMLPLFPVAWMVGHLTRRFDPLGDRLRLFVASWASAYGHATPLYRFQIEGRPHLPRDGAYVLVANHESGLDVLALLMLRTSARFLAESWLFRLPLAGGLLRRCRHIPVRPGDRESGRKSLVVAGAALAEGTPVAIFPEGEISPELMADFRPGAFVLAQRAGVPVVPVLIEGASAAWQPGAWKVEGRHTIRIAVLPAVPLEEMAGADAGRIAAETRSRLLQARRPAPPVEASR